jgi:hypothetical protein
MIAPLEEPKWPFSNELVMAMAGMARILSTSTNLHVQCRLPISLCQPLQLLVNEYRYILLRFVLFCFVLFCFVLFCFVLFCFVLFYIVSYPPIAIIPTNHSLTPHHTPRTAKK